MWYGSAAKICKSSKGFSSTLDCGGVELHLNVACSHEGNLTKHASLDMSVGNTKTCNHYTGANEGANATSTVGSEIQNGNEYDKEEEQAIACEDSPARIDASFKDCEEGDGDESKWLIY